MTETEAQKASRSGKAISDPLFIMTVKGRRKVQVVLEPGRNAYFVFYTAPGIKCAEQSQTSPLDIARRVTEWRAY